MCIQAMLGTDRERGSHNLSNRMFTNVELRRAMDVFRNQANPGTVCNAPRIGLVKQTQSKNPDGFGLVCVCTQRPFNSFGWRSGW